MQRGRLTEGRVVGGILVVLGGLSLVEAWRLHALRTQMVAGAVVGDDTFPAVVGLALIFLGGAAAFAATHPPVPVSFPRGSARTRMLAGAGVLIAYGIAVPYLGYTGSTALGAVALFRAMGGYGWARALALGAIVTGALYLLFRVWLLQPLPTGLLGI